MKINRSSKTGQMLSGAAKIVSAPSMEKTRAKVAAGSIRGDWIAVGKDLRAAMHNEKRRLEVA